MVKSQLAYPLCARWQCPKCGDDVLVTCLAVVCDLCGNEAAIDAANNRVEWLGCDVTESIASEREKYDQWAESVSVTRTSSENRGRWWAGSPGLSWARKKIQQTKEAENYFSKKIILDIGGSCLDSWSFLAEGAGSLAQVEPSPGSQALAKKRLQVELDLSEVEFARRVEFHTATCEALPFKDKSFDFVFSRATIHHTERPKSFDEIYRVLRPGGGDSDGRASISSDILQINVVGKEGSEGRPGYR